MVESMTNSHISPYTDRFAELARLIQSRDISVANGATVQYDDHGQIIVRMATCGTCGRSWNDALITDRTPVPSARCPFEYIHPEIAEYNRLSRTADAIGTKPTTIARLWKAFRTAIDAAYEASDHHDPTTALRDYAENQSMRDSLTALVDTATREERSHRSTGRSYIGDRRYRVSAEHCAKLLLLSSAGDGAASVTAPDATDWLTLRRTHCEAYLLGYLIRAHVSPDWVTACKALDYAKVVAD